jgi:outer membrane protein insertion porin family
LRRRSWSNICLSESSVSPVVTPARAVLAGVLIAVALLAAAVPAAAVPDQVTIAGLVVTGNLRTDQAAITNTFGLDLGREYPYSEVRIALERVFKMGLFDDVRLYLRDVPGGQELTVEVVERPLVTEVKTKGHTKIKKQDIVPKIQVAVGAALDQRLVDESVRAIKALYLEKGYYVASVTSQVELVKPGLAEVTFDVFEGSKVKVERVLVEGNSLVEDGKIRKAMETKGNAWYRGAKDFNPEKFDSDMDKVVRLYQELGFANAKVVSHEARIDRSLNQADLVVTVEEGPRFVVERVGVEIAEGDALEGKITEEDLALGIKLEPGAPYGIAEIEKTEEAVYSILGDQGFVFAEVEPVEVFNGDRVDLTLKVRAHQAVHVGKIVIEGNQTTYEKVIRREIMVKPGDILKRSLVERSHREIFNLGYFDDVEVATRAASEEGDIDLVFKVKEKQTGIFNVGASYSEEYGITGFIEFSHNNVGWLRKRPYFTLGKGETVSVKWEFGKLTQIDLSYRNPWFRDRPMLVGVDVYDTRSEYDTYTDKRAGFGLVAGRRFPFIDYSRVYLRYSLEHRKLMPDDDAGAYVKSQAGKRTTSRITATLTRNSVDNPFFPRDGSRASAIAEWAGSWLGGTTAYQSYTLESSSFMAVPLANSALVFRASAGVIDGLGKKAYIPLYERFRLGGTTSESVRGYDDREIVPAGNALDEGGRFMLAGSVEYRIPVIKNQAFLRQFVDAGDTWNSLRAARPGLLRRSAGFGFMIEIPMVGQIGLDVGYGFDRDKAFGGPGWKTHFQFGMSGL